MSRPHDVYALKNLDLLFIKSQTLIIYKNITNPPPNIKLANAIKPATTAVFCIFDTPSAAAAPALGDEPAPALAVAVPSLNVALLCVPPTILAVAVSVACCVCSGPEKVCGTVTCGATVSTPGIAPPALNSSMRGSWAPYRACASAIWLFSRS